MGYSIISALLIFYLIVSTCLCDNLLSKQMGRFIGGESLYAKHVLSFIMLCVILILLSNLSIEKSILYSIFGYIIFILMAKTDLQMNIIVFILLLFGFFFEAKMTQKEKQINDDPFMTLFDKQRAKNSFSVSHNVIIISTALFSIAGTYLYMKKKQSQYGGAFSYSKYFL